MKETTPAQTSATNNNGSGGGNKKKKRKFNNSKKKIPKVGDPDYLSPTQLRNRRKRRAKKQQKQAQPQSKEDQLQESSLKSNRSSSSKNISGNSNNEALQDPSMKYINYPTKAPIIRTAKKYLEPLLENNTSNVYIGPLYHWRTVSKLAVRPDHNDINKVAIGLFAENSHSLLPVPKCKAHHSSINRIVELVTKACHEVEVIPYGMSSKDDTDQQETEGQLRYIGVNIERSSGSAQLTLVWNGKREEEKEDEQLEKLLNAILSKTSGCRKEEDSGEEPPMKKRRRRGKRDDNNNNKDSYQGKDDVKKSSDHNHNTASLHSLWVNYNSSWKHSNAIFAFDPSCWRHVAGPSSITEHLSFASSTKSEGQKGVAKPAPPSYPIPLYFPPTVFRQANLDSFTNIVGRIRERVMTLAQKPFCVELYGGVGTISLYLSDSVSGLVSSDENPNNYKCFCDSVKQLPKDIQPRLSYKQKNAAEMVKTESELFQKAELLILDPPRKGLEEEVVEYLCKSEECSSIKLLVYVSCGFQAFQRDCDALLESGRWKVDSAEGHVLFPGSDAIETLAFFVPK